jgi:hypothetical protein
LLPEKRPAALAGEVWLAPAEQGDIVSDVDIHKPDQIVLIDGCFHQNLSVWHKELLYALSRPFVKRVIGAASMGAIRAADMHRLGMIGVGRIFEWYRDGVTEDDAEVALSYEPESYRNLTVPLCNVRASLEEGQEPILERLRAIHYSERFPKLVWKELGFGPESVLVDQKALDAAAAIRFAREQESSEAERPAMVENGYWDALYSIDRKMMIEGRVQRIGEYIGANIGKWPAQRFVDVLNEQLALKFASYLGLPATQQSLTILRGSLLVSRIPGQFNLEILEYLARNPVAALPEDVVDAASARFPLVT